MSSEESPCPTQQEIMCKHTGTLLPSSFLPFCITPPPLVTIFKNKNKKPYDPFEMGQIKILKYGVPPQKTSLSAWHNSFECKTPQ